MKLPPAQDIVLRQAFQTLEAEDKRNIKAGIAQPFLLLQAPNGTVYRVTVNNAGTIQTQVVT